MKDMFRGIRGYVALALTVGIATAAVTYTVAAEDSTPAPAPSTSVTAAPNADEAADPAPTRLTSTASPSPTTSSTSAASPSPTTSSTTTAAPEPKTPTFMRSSYLPTPIDGTYTVSDESLDAGMGGYYSNTSRPTIGMPIFTAGKEKGMKTQVCTLGAFAYDEFTGARFGVTAGHCGYEGSLVKWGDDMAILGYVAKQEFNKEADYAIIRLEPKYQAPGAIDIDHPEGPLIGLISPDSLRYEPEDIDVCKASHRTGVTCGDLLALSFTQAQVNVYSLSGDSGAMAYVHNPSGTLVAVGILHGSPIKPSGETIHSVTHFTAMDRVLWDNDLELLFPS